MMKTWFQAFAFNALTLTANGKNLATAQSVMLKQKSNMPESNSQILWGNTLKKINMKNSSSL